VLIEKAVTPIYDAAKKHPNIVLGKTAGGQYYAGNVGADDAAKKQALQDMADKNGQGQIVW